MFKRYGWMLLVMAPFGMLGGFLVAAVITYVMPKIYESHAVIEVKPVAHADAGSPPSRPAGAMRPSFFATEFEIMKSRHLLSKVIDSLDLLNRWAVDRESALRILKSLVRTENIRGTDLIMISVRHTDKEIARDIAAETARAYGDIRRELASKHSEKVIAEIRKVVREQEDKVEELREVLIDRGRQGNKTLLAEDDLNSSEPELIPVDREDYTDVKRDFEMELALLEQLKLKLIGEEISLNTAGDSVVIHDDPVIADSPISPNVTLNLVAGSFGGLLLPPFLSLPLMWFMSRRKSGSPEGI